MRFVCVFVLLVPSLWAQSGAAIYKQRCASCHDAPKGRIPALETIKGMSAGAIRGTLSAGVMKQQAAGLSGAQIDQLIRYIAPTGSDTTAERSCKAGPAIRLRGGESHGSHESNWSGWSPEVTNARFADSSVAGLAASDVPNLKLKWAFNLGGVVNARGQPAVAAGQLFVTTAAGMLYALDAKTGCTEWAFSAGVEMGPGVTVGTAAGSAAVFFGDSSANVYAVSTDSGKLLWKVHPEGQHSATISAIPQFYQGVLYQPFSSIEEGLATEQKYACCNFRGSVAALDASTGRTLWHTFTIAEPVQPSRKNFLVKQEYGPSGAAIWSTPTIDAQRGVLYVATGDNYSDPPTNTSDAVIAMDLKTGQVHWSQQLTAGDTYNGNCERPLFDLNCPAKHGADSDFGQPPILIDLGGGRSELVIAQKSGSAYALDPQRQGSLLWKTQVAAGGKLGGSQWGSASDGKKMYVAISDAVIKATFLLKAPYVLTHLDPAKGGGLAALDLQTGKTIWKAAAAQVCRAGGEHCSPAQSAAVTAIPGAVFSGAMDGHIRAYSANDGKVLWDFDTTRDVPTVNGAPAHGGTIDGTGPVVAGGMVFVESGYGKWSGMPGNVLLAFSVDGK